MLRALPDLAIAAVAGRDSIAAAVDAARRDGFSAILPTSVATGTEYGSADSVLEAVAVLRRLLAGEADVLDPIRIGSPGLWAAMNGRFAAEIAARWCVYSPCLACHLYVHVARIPLAWALGNAPVITGERDTHDGRIKLSQTTASIDAETRVLAHAGVELLTPIRSASHAEVETLVGGWRQGDQGLRCVHSGNYVRADGSVAFDEAGYDAYLREFFEPVGVAVVDAWRSSQTEPDYEAIVRGVLGGAGLVGAGS
ncbi:MAG: hypothetical protein WCJ13_10705 [Coriobacteriia bacterium]